MPSQAVIQIKVMPDSPSADLDKIEKQTEELILKGTKQIKKEREPIAFGLIALKISFTWPEEQSTDPLMESISKIPQVSSAEIVDYRRAIG